MEEELLKRRLSLSVDVRTSMRQCKTSRPNVRTSMKKNFFGVHVFAYLSSSIWAFQPPDAASRRSSAPPTPCSAGRASTTRCRKERTPRGERKIRRCSSSSALLAFNGWKLAFRALENVNVVYLPVSTVNSLVNKSTASFLIRMSLV